MNTRGLGSLEVERIPNNLRMQKFIEEELEKVNYLLAQTKPEELSNETLSKIGLVFLELGQFQKVEEYFSKVLAQKSTNTEVIATSHYGLAVIKREMNECDAALAEFKDALNLAKSPWLKSNILRNSALAYLKQTKFELAAQTFKQAIDEVVTSLPIHPELLGSLPALYNYHGLSLARAGLTNEEQKNNLELGLKEFDIAAKHYESFAKQGFNLENSHDYQSHVFHRGMILCESTEKYGSSDPSKSQNDLKKAEELLLKSLAGREKNKADAQRIGDVCEWLGRVYIGLKDMKKAAQYLESALLNFRKILGEVAMQTVRVKKRLADLKAFVALNQGASVAAGPASSGLSVLASSSSGQSAAVSSNDQTKEKICRMHV